MPKGSTGKRLYRYLVFRRRWHYRHHHEAPRISENADRYRGRYISAVFVKDLSRVGRNYIEVGKLTEEFFPQYDVRLVAVSDGVDSDEGDNEFTPFRNIMNEWYAKDISKKRKIVNKMKGNAGIPLSQPPYGYIKNPDDPRFWVIDRSR